MQQRTVTLRTVNKKTYYQDIKTKGQTSEIMCLQKGKKTKVC